MRKFNFYLGVAVSSWLLLALIVAAQLFAPFKTLLKNTFSHHWIGKAVIITAAFLIAGYVMRKNNSIAGVKDEKAAWYSALASLILMLLFFAVESLGE